MSEVKITDIHKTYGSASQRVLKNISFTVRDAEFVSLLGPSGCGKTSLLRIVAGLESCDAGGIFIDGEDMTSTSPRDRDIAFVFQNYALYPHFSVRENIALGLRLRKVPQDEINRRVAQTAAMLDITQYLDRQPRALSGGQRQRVALARALVRNPKVFLLDEPLSNLDARLRDKTRGELKLLFKKVRGTVIYVTHDQIEAMTLSDRIVVLKDGVIQQIGTPDEIYREPANTFVAVFIGMPPMNLIPRAKCGLLGIAPKFLAGLDGEFTCGLRPEDVSVSREPRSGWIRCGVRLCEPTGAVTLLTLELGDIALSCSTTLQWPTNSKEAYIRCDFTRLHFFDADGRRKTPASLPEQVSLK